MKPPPASTSSPNSRLALCLAVVLVGVTALLAQVLLTRELLALFLGNELSIALVLAVWLLAVSAGSAAGAWLAPRLRAPAQALGWSQGITAVLLPWSLVAARRVHPPPLTPGEVFGPGSMLWITLEVLGPLAALGGFQFVTAAAARQARADRDARAVGDVATVYALEALGAALGGIAFHLYLAEQLMPLSTASALGLLNVASAVTLLRPRRSAQGVAHWVAALALAAGLLWMASKGPFLELTALRASPRWSGLHPVAFVPSRYGALVVTEREGQVSLYQSGVLLFTSQDDYANEVTAHLALLEHPHPRQVLLIGGAASGLAKEILKHPVETLDCVELDPRVIALARRWLPESLVAPLREARVRLHVGDARLEVRNAQSRYDVVILNLPDPTTAAINRFYTQEFLQELKQALRPGGIACLGITGSEVHLSGSVLRGVATLDHTLSLVLPERFIVPGDRTLFLAAGAGAALTSDWRVLSQRLAARRVSTRFVNDAWLRDALLPFRADLIRQAVSQAPSPRLNTDLNPVSYYYQGQVWLEQVAGGRSAGLAFPGRAAWWVGLAVVAMLALLALVKAIRDPAAAVLIGVAAVGGFGLVVELLALLVFQSACGYLYHALGVLTAVFMVGLGVGAALVGSRQMPPSPPALLLASGVGTAALVSLALPNLLRAVVASPTPALPVLGALLLLSGSLVGAMFPVGAALYRHRRGMVASAGAVYAADLIGSAGAALAAGTLAVPLLGANGTSLIAAGVLVLALALVLARRRV